MQVGPEKSKISFFAISCSSKIHPTHKHSNTCHGLNFYLELIFLSLNARVYIIVVINIIVDNNSH